MFRTLKAIAKIAMDKQDKVGAQRAVRSIAEATPVKYGYNQLRGMAAYVTKKDIKPSDTSVVAQRGHTSGNSVWMVVGLVLTAGMAVYAQGVVAGIVSLPAILITDLMIDSVIGNYIDGAATQVQAWAARGAQNG